MSYNNIDNQFRFLDDVEITESNYNTLGNDLDLHAMTSQEIRDGLGYLVTEKTKGMAQAPWFSLVFYRILWKVIQHPKSTSDWALELYIVEILQALQTLYQKKYEDNMYFEIWEVYLIPEMNRINQLIQTQYPEIWRKVQGHRLLPILDMLNHTVSDIAKINVKQIMNTPSGPTRTPDEILRDMTKLVQPLPVVVATSKKPKRKLFSSFKKWLAQKKFAFEGWLILRGFSFEGF